MPLRPGPYPSSGTIGVTEDVIEYINKRKSDFRISTSCGGPILLPVIIKPPKKTDIPVPAGDYVIFVSIHQAQYLSTIHMGMVPLFPDDFCE
jgi:hypothetical protein